MPGRLTQIDTSRLNFDFLTPINNGLNLEAIYAVFSRKALNSTMEKVQRYGLWELDAIAGTLQKKAVDAKGNTVYLRLKNSVQGVQVVVYPVEVIYLDERKSATQICDVFSNGEVQANNQNAFSREQIAHEVQQLIAAIDASQRR